jgi:hypothetical protein
MQKKRKRKAKQLIDGTLNRLEDKNTKKDGNNVGACVRRRFTDVRAILNVIY